MKNTSKLVFIDSKIWLYCFLSGQDKDPEEDARKRAIANSITDVEGIVISTQVINEVCSVLKRKLGFNIEKPGFFPQPRNPVFSQPRNPVFSLPRNPVFSQPGF